MSFEAVVTEKIKTGLLTVSIVSGSGAAARKLCEDAPLFDVLVDILNGAGGEYFSDASSLATLADAKKMIACVFDNREARAYSDRLVLYKLLTEKALKDEAAPAQINEELRPLLEGFKNSQDFLTDFERYVKELPNIDSAELFYKLDTLELFLTFAISRAADNSKPLKLCQNCGKYFIASQDNARFCPSASPQNPDVSCQIYGSYTRYIEERRGDGVKAIHSKLHNMLAMRAKRSGKPEDVAAKEAYFTEYKARLRKLELGELAEKNMLEWLEEQQNKLKK